MDLFTGLNTPSISRRGSVSSVASNSSTASGRSYENSMHNANVALESMAANKAKTSTQRNDHKQHFLSEYKAKLDGLIAIKNPQLRISEEEFKGLEKRTLDSLKSRAPYPLPTAEIASIGMSTRMSLKSQKRMGGGRRSTRRRKNARKSRKASRKNRKSSRKSRKSRR